MNWKTLESIRREYGNLSLDEDSVNKDPIAQFKQWFEEVLLVEHSDPTAMVLSTVDNQGLPDSRVVLLKSLHEDTFVFYTNYESTKAIQFQHVPFAALNFYWPQMARQVRIRGRIKRLPKSLSDDYFSSRPITSQLSALVSPQSKPISDRQALDIKFNELLAQQGSKPILRPKHWGGYMVIPKEFEFWQGRDNRLHDRIFFNKTKGEWKYYRLAP